MRSNDRYAVMFVALVLVTALSSTTWAQQIGPQGSTGLQPYDPYGGTRENINLATGNLDLQIPLVSLPGRNGHNLSLKLHYDSKIWLPHSEYDPDTGQYFYYWDYDSAGYFVGTLGWRLNVPVLTSSVVMPYPTNSKYQCQGAYVLITGDGSKHAFYCDTSPANGPRTHCVFYSTSGTIQEPQLDIATGSASDSSYFLLDVTNPSDIVARAEDGTAIHFGNYAGGPATKIEDTNGNIISFQTSGNPISVKDTLGRSVTVTWGMTTTISYKDSTGTSRTITIALANQTLNPSFQNPLPGSGPPTSANLISSITLPNNLTWSFQYNTFGELTKISYPTGGYTRYDYTPYTNWIQSLPPNPSFAADFREVTAKYLCRLATGNCSPSTTPEDVTTYTPTVDGTKTNNQYMDEVSPLGDRTRHQLSYLTSSAGYSNRYSMREIFRYHYQGQNALLRTVQTDYNNLDANGNTQNASLPIRETTTLNDVSPVLISKTEWDYTGTADDVLEERAYDFGSGSVGALVRKKDYTWLAVNPVNSQDYTSNALHILNRKASEQTKDSSSNIVAQTQFEYDNYAANGNLTASGAVQHDSTFGISFTTRGNATTVKRWRNTDGAWLSTSSQYDDAGNALKITDPLGHQTQFSYSDSWGNSACLPSGGSAAAYLTTITNALTQQIKNTYNSCSGTIASLKDQNDINAGGAGTTYTYNLMNRVLTKILPDGGQTSMTYNDVPPVSSTSSSNVTSSLNLVSTTILDGLGRPKQSQLVSDPQGTVFADTTYDALDRKSTVSNLYRSTSDTTYGITTGIYDALGRITKLIPPDGTTSANNVTMAYSGNCTTATDQAGKARKSCSDGLGRLTQVFEDPGSSPHLNYETDYAYDPLGNLLTVNQKGGTTDTSQWRTRTFAYNSLSQLLTAANPESGSITYSYDNAGNLATKTAPKPNQTGSLTVVTTNSYDFLNRLTQKSYNDGTTPTVKYGYDGVAPSGCTPPTLTIGNPIGRRTSMCDGGGASAWSLDLTAGTGWKTTEARTTNGVTKNTIYQDNLGGSVTALTNPSGRTVTYTLQSSGTNTAGRMLSAVDTANSINYATAAAYAPTGTLSSLSNGTSLVETNYYNSRLQPCRISAKSTGTAPSSCTDSANIGNVLDFTYNFSLGSADNGNVTSIANNRDTTRSPSFTYDALNRISTAKTSSTSGTKCWDEQFAYDPWANLLTIGRISGYACSNEELLNLAATPKNQISGNTYDSAGNLINDGLGHAYTFNAENQLLTAAGVTYTYDGDGKRIQKSNGKLYWYGTGSDPVTETDASGNPSEEYIFFGGKRTARIDLPSAVVHYYFSDHLGSANVVTSSAGVIQDESDYYPFGGERAITNSDPNNYKFTGKERDSESGLDYFGKRYFGSGVARFISPDILGHQENPQSLNRYAYVWNNPLRYVDPDGQDPQGAPTVFTTKIATYVQPTWEEIGDDSTKGHLIGGANGKGGSQADYDSLLEWNLNYTYRGSKRMSVQVTFVTDDKGVTAELVTPYASIEPQPLAIDSPPGTYRQFSPFSDPNDPTAFNFSLEQLSGIQLAAVKAAVAKKPNDRVAAALLIAIWREENRRAEERRRMEEKEEREREKRAKTPPPSKPSKP